MTVPRSEGPNPTMVPAELINYSTGRVDVLLSIRALGSLIFMRQVLSIEKRSGLLAERHR